MNPSFELLTPRLKLRPFVIEDADWIFELNQDPDVIRYTGDAPWESIAQVNDFLLNYDHMQKYHCSRMAVIHQNSGQVLGWCGLKYNEDIGLHDLGYRFFKQFWGQGFATEAGKACLEDGFQRLRPNSIIGRVMKGNTASVRVLEKLGMHWYREAPCGTEPGDWYLLLNPFLN